MAKATAAIAEFAHAAKALEEARELSVQERATQEGTTYGTAGFLLYMARAGELVSPWWSTQRDVELGNFWKRSDHVSGSLVQLTTRVANVPVQVLPRDTTVKAHIRQADEFQRKLIEESDFGQGWIETISRFLEDWWCLAGKTRIALGGDRRGKTKTIAKMVKERDVGPVLAVLNGQIVERKVVEWHKTPLGDRKWWWISLRNASGHSGSRRGGMHITEDHPVLTDEGWLPASEVKAGMMVASGDPSPNRAQSELLVGALLGDASMAFVKKRALLRFTHSVKQEEWFDFKLAALAGFQWTGRAKRAARFAPGAKNESESVSVNSRASLGLVDWYRAWYGNGGKTVARDFVREHFSPRMLAVWYCDDGSINRRKTRAGNYTSPNGALYTNAFDPSDVEWLVQLLVENGVDCKVIRTKIAKVDGGYPVIQITCAGFRALVEMIGPYVPPCMRYKLPKWAPAYDASLWDVESAELYYDVVEVSEQRDYMTGSSYKTGKPVQVTYHIGVDEARNFIAANVVVHNTADNGGFLEIIGDGDPAGPIEGPAAGVASLDSRRCIRTGNVEYPVTYLDTDGEAHRMHRTRVAFASDFPSSRAEMRGVGFSAMSRCINNAQTLTDVLTYNQEKMGSRPKRAIITAKGIRTDLVLNALRASEHVMDSRGLARYAETPVIGDLPLDAMLELIELSGVPDGFDYSEWIRLGMFAMALAFGVPIRWIWPAAVSGATKADAMYQHIAGLGGGVGKVLKVITLLLGGDPRGPTHTIGKFLPPHLKLVFDFQDDEQDRMRAEIAQMRAETAKVDLESGVITARVAREQALEAGRVSQVQFDQMEAHDGRLPDGSDVLTLFHSTEPFYLRWLDLGVDDPLAVDANDPDAILAEVEQAALNVNDLVANSGNPNERRRALLAVAALGKLKGMYEPIVAEMVQAEVEAEIEAEAEAARRDGDGGDEGKKQFSWGATTGEIIRGQLARGAGGQFVSADEMLEQIRQGMIRRRQSMAGRGEEGRGGAAAAKRAANRAAVAEAMGLDPATVESLAAMRSGAASEDQYQAMVGQGLAQVNADGSITMKSAARSLLNAANSGDVDRAREAMAKAKEPPKEKPGRKPGKSPEQRERERQERQAERERERLETLANNRIAVAEAMGADAASLPELIDFADGADLDPVTAKGLAGRGLVELDPEGQPRMTSAGRALVRAMDSGDVRAAKDAASRGREKVGDELERAEADRAKAEADRDRADQYEMEGDELDARADGVDAEADELMAQAAEAEDEEERERLVAKAEKAQERADKLRERAEKKRERAAAMRERAVERDARAQEREDSVGGYPVAEPEIAGNGGDDEGGKGIGARLVDAALKLVGIEPRGRPLAPIADDEEVTVSARERRRAIRGWDDIPGLEPLKGLLVAEAATEEETAQAVVELEAEGGLEIEDEGDGN